MEKVFIIGAHYTEYFVALVLAEASNTHVRFRRLGLDESRKNPAGDQQYLQQLHGLDGETVYQIVLHLLGG